MSAEKETAVLSAKPSDDRREFAAQIDDSKWDAYKEKTLDPTPLVLTVNADGILIGEIQSRILDWGYNHLGAANASEMWKHLNQILPSVILLESRIHRAQHPYFPPQALKLYFNRPIISITLRSSASKNAPDAFDKHRKKRFLPLTLTSG